MKAVHSASQSDTFKRLPSNAPFVGHPSGALDASTGVCPGLEYRIAGKEHNAPQHQKE